MAPELDFVLRFILSGVAAGYVTTILLLEKVDSHEGPFKLPNRWVLWTRDGHHQRVSLFDWIRRIFGVYKVRKDDDGKIWWVVNEEAAERWQCPICLSLWVSIPATIILMITDMGLSLETPLVLLSLAYLSSVTSKILDRL